MKQFNHSTVQPFVVYGLGLCKACVYRDKRTVNCIDWIKALLNCDMTPSVVFHSAWQLTFNYRGKLKFKGTEITSNKRGLRIIRGKMTQKSGVNLGTVTCYNQKLNTHI